MIAPMTKYSFILLSGMQDSLMDTLQETGLVDISRSSKPVDDRSRELVAEIELLDGLIKGLEKAEVPEGTEPEYIDGDIENCQQQTVGPVAHLPANCRCSLLVKQSLYYKPNGNDDIYVRKEFVRSPLVHVCRLIWRNGENAAHDTYQIHEQKHTCHYGT